MHATLCDLLTDLVQNSVEAGATRIDLTIRETEKLVEFEVKDNGKGMDSETQVKAIDPFYSDGRKHAHRRVGLGLPFMIQTAEATGGSASIDSRPGCGTVVRFKTDAKHIDLPPFGDFAGTAAMILTLMPSGEITLVRECGENGYTVIRSEIEEALGELHSAENLTLLKTYLAAQEDNLRKAG